MLFFCCFSSTFFLAFQTTRLGGFLAWFWNLLVLRSHGVLLPGAAFFEAIVPASAAAAATCEQLQATDSLEKSCFSRISNDISSSSRRHQFCEQPQATESVDKCCFSRFPDDTLGSFFAWFCSSFRAMVFCCRELLFSKLFYRHQQQQPPPPVLRAAAGNRICRQMLFF